MLSRLEAKFRPGRPGEHVEDESPQASARELPPSIARELPETGPPETAPSAEPSTEVTADSAADQGEDLGDDSADEEDAAPVAEELPEAEELAVKPDDVDEASQLQAGDEEPEEPAEPEPAAVADEEEEDDGKDWYVLKVQSNREKSIREAILRRIKIAGLEEHVDEVLVPTEKVSEIKGGKKRVMERKFFPGYIMVRLRLTDDVWFTIRETPGVGDFVGSGGQPVPMASHDVDRMLGRKKEVEQAAPPA